MRILMVMIPLLTYNAVALAESENRFWIGTQVSRLSLKPWRDGGQKLRYTTIAPSWIIGVKAISDRRTNTVGLRLESYKLYDDENLPSQVEYSSSGSASIGLEVSTQYDMFQSVGFGVRVLAGIQHISINEVWMEKDQSSSRKLEASYQLNDVDSRYGIQLFLATATSYPRTERFHLEIGAEVLSSDNKYNTRSDGSLDYDEFTNAPVRSISFPNASLFFRFSVLY